MEKRITFVGLDAHKVSIKVAALLPAGTTIPLFSIQLWGSQSTDEGRHDPEDTRRSFATGRLRLLDSRD